MKYTLILIMTMLFSSFSSFAQEETKKVIIIKKVKDENGKVTTEKTKASGVAADKLLEELKKDGTLDGIDIEIEIEKAIQDSKKKSKTTTEDIKIEKTMVDGKEATTYTITTNDGGNKKVMVWAGEGEMPVEMAEKIKKHKFKTEEGEEMIFIGDNEDVQIHEEVRIEIESPNKVSLGIMVNDDQGVTVEKIVEDSVAEKAGLESGDIILKINDSYTFNVQMLMTALSAFDKGDDCNVRFIREGKEKSVDVKF